MYRVTARRFAGIRDAEGFPTSPMWEEAPTTRFHHDWQGKNPDPQRETEVRVLWTADALYLRFVAHFRDITVFDVSETNGRRDRLWERDVAEVFLQPDASDICCYKEFEVSPNGFWIDLDIVRGEKRDLNCRLKRRVGIDEVSKTWKAELILPMTCLTANFDPTAAWCINFYRVEGACEPRFYSAWSPTGTSAPNFHVPAAFGKLVFET